MESSRFLPALHQALLENDRTRAIQIAQQLLCDEAFQQYPQSLQNFVSKISSHGGLEPLDGTSDSRQKLILVYLDDVSTTRVSGWAHCPADPNAVVSIEIRVNDRVISFGAANLYREDLFAHGYHHGRYGFDIRLDGLEQIIPNQAFSLHAYTSFSLAVMHNLQFPGNERSDFLASSSSDSIGALVKTHSMATECGPMFEEARSYAFPGHLKHEDGPLVFAFYLPQFHRTSVNDDIWGTGFTEWRQLARSIPRFRGHYQPRIPRDLGFYDLSNTNTLPAQVALAEQAGIGAFCYYYYAFGRQRVLHEPLDYHIESSTDFPLLIMWANENWTKTWDGLEDHVILKQDYLDEDEDWLLADLAKYFLDRRYVCLSGRPLFIIYRPKLLPSPRSTIARWREKLRDQHNVNPLFFMVQGFESNDPHEFGCDGAIEFPPHKLATPHPGVAVEPFSSDFRGRVIEYDDFVKTSLEEESPSFPLIKTLCPSWDNDARRPNSGLSLHNATPFRYQCWLTQLLLRSSEHKVYGRSVVAINAWNEWAEAAYLEPDVYFGSAYLNATARSLISAFDRDNMLPMQRSHRVTVILPCYNHAQFLQERINSVVNQTYPPSEIIFLDDASTDGGAEIAEELLKNCGIPYKIILNAENSGNVFKQWFRGLDESQHELVWIAETDDSADVDFLKRVLTSFRSSSISGVLGRIRIVDENNTILPDLDPYFRNLRFHTWNADFSIPAAKSFAYDFSVCNVIPNASGFVFRKPILTEEERAKILKFSFCGDWLFYAYVVRGGAIGYVGNAYSYFRKSSSSASRSKFSSAMHLEEHRMILQDISAEYGTIADSVIEAHARRILPFFPDESPIDLIEKLAPASVKAPLKVCIAAHSFMVGGGEVVPIQIANYLRSTGHHVTFLVLESNDEGSNTLRDRLRSDVPVVHFSEVQHDLEDFLAAYEFDVFNSHNVGVEYHFWRRKVDFPCLWFSSLHGGHETVPNLLIPDFIEYVSRHVDAWLYLAEKNRKILEDANLTTVNFIKTFNGVDISSVDWVSRSAFRDRYHVQDDHVAVVICSRAIPEKGWDAAIDVIHNVNAETCRAHLFLIGSGPVYDELFDVYNDHQYIHLLGHLDSPIRFFKSFDLAIFPTTFAGETYPMFLVEALSAGLPVLSTNIGEIPNILGVGDDAAGLLFQCDQARESLVSQMTTELSTLLGDRDCLLRFQQNALRRSKSFMVSTQVDSMLDLAHGLLRNSG